ncbi:MAG: SMP-30/gluconolactonase/LRE family protein [Clostridia bacterium]|nr:SMP-30/gluconolactonase/LRE family protein [Clostridia bacterium]
MSEFKVLGKDNVLLGEGPMWDDDLQRVKYIDINGKSLITLNLDTEQCEVLDLPEQTGCIAKCSDGRYLYAATTAVFDDKLNRICSFPNGKGARFNDGKATPDGKFLVGTIERNCGGGLYCLENGKLTEKIGGVSISNGLDWSLDNKILYYCDTPTRKIVAYSYPEFEFIKTVIDFNEIDGFTGNPDGLCIDMNENLWVAIWGGSCVVCVDTKTSKITQKIDFPVKYISCPSFVGKNMDLLFLTSAKHDDTASLAGKCFVLDVGVTGRKPYKVDTKNL